MAILGAIIEYFTSSTKIKIDFFCSENIKKEFGTETPSKDQVKEWLSKN